MPTSRGPILVGRRELPLQRATVFAVSSLLVGALTPGPAPLPLQSSGKSLPLQVQIVPGISPNANTSQGMPVTLRPISVVQSPLTVPPGTAPDAASVLRVPTGTSLGTPKPLYRDSIPPRVNPSGFQVALQSAVTDTSQSSKAILGVVLAPFANPVQGALQWVWPVTDTSQSSWFARIQNPVVNTPSLQVFWPGQVADTSRSTAKVFLGDATLPKTNLPSTAADSSRVLSVLSNTTQSGIKSAVVVQSPFVNSPQPGVQKPPQSSQVLLYRAAPGQGTVVAPVPPISNSTWTAVQYPGQVADTSYQASLALELAPPPVPPKYTPVLFAPLWPWQVVDTTNVMSIALQTYVPPIPPATLPTQTVPIVVWQENYTVRVFQEPYTEFISVEAENYGVLVFQQPYVMQIASISYAFTAYQGI